MKSRSIFLLIYGLLYGLLCDAQINELALQDHAVIKSKVEEFLRAQNLSNRDKTEIIVSNIDTRLKLSACENLSAFLPPGAKILGKTTVAVRCTAPRNWLLYLSAQVHQIGRYLVSARALTQGEILSAGDLILIQGELSAFSQETLQDFSQIQGKSLRIAVPAGLALHMDMFKTLPVIQQGQAVKILSKGVGFNVTNDGIAMHNANEGQSISARTQSGQLILGLARAGGIVEIQN